LKTLLAAWKTGAEIAAATGNFLHSFQAIKNCLGLVKPRKKRDSPPAAGDSRANAVQLCR
jgi:hypothetical protein